MVELRKVECPSEKVEIKCPYAMTPTRIVIHNTANDASAANEIAYMLSNNKETSFHFAVDDKEIVQGIPLNRNAWHAGDGNGKGNREGIAIEICYLNIKLNMNPRNQINVTSQNHQVYIAVESFEIQLPRVYLHYLLLIFL